MPPCQLCARAIRRALASTSDFRCLTTDAYGVGLGAGDGRGLGVGWGLAVGVGLGVNVAVAVGVTVAVAVAVAVAVGVTVAVAVAVAVAVGVGGTVAVGVGRGFDMHPAILTVSTRQPSLEPLVSLAIRQRSLLFGGKEKGRLTTVVMKPCELPLQA